MFSALFELLTGNFLFFALHFDSRSVFPKPLSAKEERECFERMAQGDKAAKDKLIEHKFHRSGGSYLYRHYRSDKSCVNI